MMHTDGLAYVKEPGWPNLMGPDGKGDGPKLQMAQGTAEFPDSILEDVITAAEDCPGECIFIEE
jgi:ferredoxin